MNVVLSDCEEFRKVKAKSGKGKAPAVPAGLAEQEQRRCVGARVREGCGGRRALRAAAVGWAGRWAWCCCAAR
jgi:hypothetical protein